jgi:predicted outer membrane protein
MTKMSRRAALYLMAAMPLAACETTKSTPTPTGDMDPGDLEFVTNAFNIIEFDRDECTIAQKQATSAEVRALAVEMLQQANDFDAKLRPIAAAIGIKPPNVLRTNLKIRAARLKLGQGRDFDKSFLEDQIFSHQDTLNMQQAMMDSTTGNPQLKDLSRQGTTILTDNLKKLHDLQRKVMMMR